MRLSVLGSGSAGNSIYVRAGQTSLLIDAGLSARQVARRLREIGADPDTIAGIVVTHDHGDHTRGVGVFARRHATTVFCTEATAQKCKKLFKGSEQFVYYRSGFPFEIGDLRVEPFATVHDAVDPVAVSLQDLESGARLGIATDLGRPTAQVRHALRHCHFLVLEANHDELLLQVGPYPIAVKSRIASSHGHLSNQEAARLATELHHPQLVGVVLAHLSEACNRPDLAEQVVGAALRRCGFRGYLRVAGQDTPTPLVDIERLRATAGGEQLSLL